MAEDQLRGLSPYDYDRLLRAVLAAVTVNVATTSTTGTPLVRIDRYSGADTDWQTLLTWTVSAGKTGDLHEIALTSSNDSKTRYRITIAGTDQAIPDKTGTSPLTMAWRGNSLAAGSVVLVEVKSTDGTGITGDGTMTGAER